MTRPTHDQINKLHYLRRQPRMGHDLGSVVARSSALGGERANEVLVLDKLNPPAPAPAKPEVQPDPEPEVEASETEASAKDEAATKDEAAEVAEPVARKKPAAKPRGSRKAAK